MAKTKPISIRFDEQDLLLAKNLSGIKKPQKLIDTLISEYVRPLKGSPIELPKDYMNIKSIGVMKKDGTIDKIFEKETEAIAEHIKESKKETTTTKGIVSKFKVYDYSAMPQGLLHAGREAWKKKAREEQDGK